MTTVTEASRVPTPKLSDPIKVGGDKGGGSSRVKLLLAIAGGVLLLAVVVPRLLGGGGDSGADGGLQSTPFTTTTTVAPAPAPQAPSSGRNPFAVPAGLASPAVAATLISSATPTSPADTTPTTTAPPADPATPVTTTSPAGIRFILWEVSDGPVAHVSVDDSHLTVGVDETFLGSYRVVALDLASRCGVFVYGDRRIALCEGEESVL